MSKKNKFFSFLNNTITFFIILVIIQMLLEDIAIICNFSYSTIITLKISSFIFDIIFTLEFIVRFIYSLTKKKTKKYFIYERGWIDLLASLPLLLFVSGPFVLRFLGITIFTINSLKNIPRLLKLIKIIRVAKILRFIRVLKIFGKIKNTKTQTTQRNVNYLSTLIVISIIIFIFGVQILQSNNIIPSFEKSSYIKKDLISQNIVNSINNNKKEIDFYPEIMQIEKNKNILYTSKQYSQEKQKDWQLIDLEGYTKIEKKSNNNTYKFVYSNIDILKTESIINLISFSLIILLILIIAFIYSRYFAITITDPIFVMKKGFEEQDYTLAVKIPEKFKDNDDIFILADKYNEIWLPKKMKELQSEKPKESLLKFTDVFLDLNDRDLNL